MLSRAPALLIYLFVIQSLQLEERSVMYCLYCHTNKVNGKRYFGITGVNPKRRWAAGHGYSTSRHFRHAIEKYGWDSFEHEIIAEGLTKQEACEMEREYIERYNTTDERYGYNLSQGGQGGRLGTKQTDEWKAKMSELRKGRVLTEEHKRKLSEAAKGRKFSDEHRAKLRDAKVGRPLSDEHRRKLSEAMKGKRFTDEHKQKLRESKRSSMKKVYCRETDTVYESVADAARELGVGRANLSATCKGKHKHVGGYHVEYSE